MPFSKLYISFINTNNIKSSSSIDFSLNTDDVIIFNLYLPDYIELANELTNFLNPEECIRAERFHKEIDRNRFIICRSILKFVIAAYTKLEVKNIYFDYNFNKKPYLASHPWLFFNISHSEDFAVIAISRNKVGIDIEYISEDFNFTNLLSDVFVDTEILAVQNAVNKKHAFYTLWTRKEAFVKALGKGIDEDFKNIPSLDGQHTINSSILKTIENWQVFSFDLTDNYLGAVAFENLSTIPKNLLLYRMPNSLKELFEMIKTRND